VCSGIYNICCSQGSDYSLTLSVTDNNNVPINLSGYSGLAPIKERFGDSAPLDYMSVSVLVPVSGIICLSLTRNQTANLPVTQARYELEIYPSSGSATKYLRGYFEIEPELSI
jgi:hypothetical protein